ncbi:MAG: nuclear transport factor 2 family protein [Bacteroidota bacterium]
MKKFILSCFLMLMSCICLHAQDRQAIIKLMEKQRQDWNRGDIDGFMQGYWKSDSLMFVGKTGPTYGWQNTLNNYKRGYPDKATMGILTFDILKVDVLDPKNAFVFGAWHVKQEKGIIGGYYTLWFKKIDGVWKIVCDHTS